MEGGQKIDINLEAPLDTKSSDMLVSIQDVKFAHNRQKYQGHVLPSSLRYEANGWAAGWYVYDFKMGGGYIFSKNDTPVIEGGEWIAADRSKINTTPTYVISFYTARAKRDFDDNGVMTRLDVKNDADAVQNIQVQAWWNESASINARECADASIDFSYIPVLTFNYAVEGVDYWRQIQFTPFRNIETGVVFDTPEEQCFTTLPASGIYTADLTMEYVSRAADGTVTAILNNNEVRWNWRDILYVPNDLVDDEGNKYGKLDNVVDQVITWQFGKDLLKYYDTYQTFEYDNISDGSIVYKNPGQVLQVPFTLDINYTVSVTKYYSRLNNITWSVQGTKQLFNNESDTDPVNRYVLDTSNITQKNIDIHNGAFLTEGVSGPDVSLISQLVIPLRNLPDNITVGSYSTNASFVDSQNYLESNTPCITPIFNTIVKGFKMPGEDTARNVMIQVYYKYPGRAIDNIGTIDDAVLHCMAITYKHAAMGAYAEVVYGGTAVAENVYNVDGSNISNNTDGLQIGNKIIWGRKSELDISITSINSVNLGTPLTVKSKGVNLNLIFSKYDSDDTLSQRDSTAYGYATSIMDAPLMRFSTSNDLDLCDEDYDAADETSWPGGANSRHTRLTGSGNHITIQYDVQADGSVICTPTRTGTYWWWGTVPVLDEEGNPTGEERNQEYYTPDWKFPCIIRSMPFDNHHSDGGISDHVRNDWFRDGYGMTFIVPVLRIPFIGDDLFLCAKLHKYGASSVTRDALVSLSRVTIDVNGWLRLTDPAAAAAAGVSFSGICVIKDGAIYALTHDISSSTHHGSPAGSSLFDEFSTDNYVIWDDRQGLVNDIWDSKLISNINVRSFNYTTIATAIINNVSMFAYPVQVQTSGYNQVAYIRDYFYYPGTGPDFTNTPANTFILNVGGRSGTLRPFIFNPSVTRPIGFGGAGTTWDMYTASGYWIFDMTARDHWLTATSGNSIANITGSNLSDKICIDIKDIDTGELLLDHRIDTVVVTPGSRYSINLAESALVKGKLLFNNTLVGLSGNWGPELEAMPLSTLYSRTKLSGAFFPICSYEVDGSIYSSASKLGGCQGIVVFNTTGVSNVSDTAANYSMFLMSPLSNYVLPPKLDTENSKIVIFAQKTYTHHIKCGSSKLISGYQFIDDTFTAVSNIKITPRSNLYSSNNVALETNNKYYVEGKTLIDPTSITYYNNQIHITYKPASDNTILINNSTHDLSTSDMSIKQEADLVSLSLPKYTDADTKYNFVIGDHDNVLNVKETKEIINTISDVKKHWVTAEIQSIVFSDKPVVNVLLKEYHDNDNNESNNDNLLPGITRLVSYDSDFNFNDLYHSGEQVINRTYSDDNQIVLNSTVSGIANIQLPLMPAANVFKYNVSDNKVSIVDGNNSFKYDYTSNLALDMVIRGKQIARASVTLEATDNSHMPYNTYTVSVDQNINTFVYFKHFGIYKFAGIKTDTITPKVKELIYDPDNTGNKRKIAIRLSDMAYLGTAEVTPVGINVQYVLDMNDFEDKSECTPKYLDFLATDIRDDNEDTKTKYFARVMADSEYQLVKQHWDSTVRIENYWWIDESHTLKLTKDRFILERKVTDGEYDDWMGDKWEAVYELPKTDYITSEADTFICSSASGRNARSYLYILKPETETSISVTIFDPLNNMQQVYKYTITFKHIELGTAHKHIPLNSVNDCSTLDFVVGTYSDILSSALLSDSKLSAVCINGVHWLGIQYDNNFNQWSFAFGASHKIIQGYGCVGINGVATGGMIPAEYFNGLGFNDAVYNVNELEAEEDITVSSLDSFNLFNKRVVGDENQQWYISEELKDIVMAVDLVKGNTTKLPITNKYAQIYSSPSYAKYTVHALGIQIKQLVNLFGDDDNAVWKEIIKYAMFPLVWYLSPYTNVINYLQQTLGQYAYVHYNSTSVGKQSSRLFTESTDDNAGLSDNSADNHIDALVTDDLSFDVVHIPQEQSFKDNAWDNVLGIFASMVVSATDYAMRDLTVNSLQNQSAVSDIGKKFSQSFLQNIGSMSVTGFNMQSTKPMLKSEVTAVKTLDMFYSTSAQQRCYAGPGFVNMQFVAQCTAQSVTSVQLEAQQTQVFVLLRQLTTWQGKAIIFLLDSLKDLMFKMSDNMSQGPTGGFVVGLGWIPALVTSGIGYALVAAKSMVKLGIQTVDEMLDSFFTGGIKTNVSAQLSRHNYDIEGKHAYGNKSECFMWPCADCKSKLYTDESVEATLQNKSWPLEMPKASVGNSQTKSIYTDQPDCTTIVPNILDMEAWDGEVPYSIAMCKGLQRRRALPDSTAYVIGAETFMPAVPFKNENIGEGEPVFTPPPVQDYIIDKNWNLFVTAMAGDALWVSCKDTKLFDGNYSNIVVTDSFCGIAAPHIAMEIKRNICEEYLRPWAVSPDAIALNITGLNCAYEEVAYHAFDGYGYRITDWLGSSGMNKEHYTLQYCFQVNDRFKRSNKLPPNQFMGNFQAVPSMSLDIKDKIFNDIQVTTEEKGMRTGVAGENKDTQRYALPIFTEQISSLPAIVRALSPYKLAVVDGITSLTTDVRTSQSAYKIPDSVDFNINDKLYRMTNEYICSVDHQKGLEVVKYLVPALGLTYLGATPFMAYFYNQATRQYYIYQGGNTLQVMEMLERFRDIKSGTYDFINQEVVMPCLATMTRLDKKVKDDADETDNIVIPVFRRNNVGGELTPPITTIFNTKSWYRTVSTAAGLVFQGPNRCIINRFIWSQYMLKDIKANKGKWKKVPREEYHPFREYSQKYETMPRRVSSDAVKGWTHNPFLLVTAPLGINEETDCKFEWEITFAWTTEMEQLYEYNEYVTVNVMAETMSAGGKVCTRPTHIFLHKELFTRSNNYGYYSFRYQGNNGMGNRERLHIWSDGYIAVSSIQLECKDMTNKRSEILVTQEDIKGMKEM